MEFGSHTNILYVACWSTPGLVGTSAQSRPKSSGISSCSPLKWPTLYVGYTTFPYISRFEYTDNHWYTVPLSLQKHWQSLGWDEWWGPMRPMRPMLDSEVHDVLTSADDKHLYIASSPGKLLSLRVGWIYTIHMYIVYVMYKCIFFLTVHCCFTLRPVSLKTWILSGRKSYLA